MTTAVRLSNVKLPSDIPGDLDDSRICYWKATDYWPDQSELWLVYLPGAGIGNLSRHTVEEHEDGTITVSPSLVLRGGENRGYRHGFLRRGEWHPCSDDRP